MTWTLVIWLISAGLMVALMTQRHWDMESQIPDKAFRIARRTAATLLRIPVKWLFIGYPVTVARIFWTWRRLSYTAGLSVVRRPSYAVVGDQAVRGMTLRPLAARLSLPVPTTTGLRVRVDLHPGQTPAAFMSAADAFAHAWRMYAVRVTSPRRGEVVMTATAHDPLAESPALEWAPRQQRLLTADIGRQDDGASWLLNFRVVPHWLITGATQSGKSTLLATLICRLAPQPVALVGIDLKGGLELGLVRARLSALATTRAEAAALLDGLVREAQSRMQLCHVAGVRSVWELPTKHQQPPVVVLVDEVAELYLSSDSSRASREEQERCAAALLRLGQLGAALGIHLVISSQRLGSELGRLVTALRAQLGGRICHRVADDASAEMTLGDLAPDAVMVARSITADEPGVAVTTATGASWVRARSWYTSAEHARDIATLYAGLTPRLLSLAGTGLDTGGGQP